MKTIAEIIRKLFPLERPPTTLGFGKQAWIDIQMRISNAPGVFVHLMDEIPDEYPKVDFVRAIVGKDPHFHSTLDGYYERHITIEEILTRWPGPYELILFGTEMMNRDLFENTSIQNMLPYVYALVEDGHNEALIEPARDRGYVTRIVDRWRLFVHREQKREERAK